MARERLFRIPRLLAEPAGNDDAHRGAGAGERIVLDERFGTAVAVAAAVLLVALIAVLMGTVGP
jgi:hypothetical protein